MFNVSPRDDVYLWGKIPSKYLLQSSYTFPSILLSMLCIFKIQPIESLDTKTSIFLLFSLANIILLLSMSPFKNYIAIDDYRTFSSWKAFLEQVPFRFILEELDEADLLKGTVTFCSFCWRASSVLDIHFISVYCQTIYYSTGDLENEPFIF